MCKDLGDTQKGRKGYKRDRELYIYAYIYMYINIFICRYMKNGENIQGEIQLRWIEEGK